MGTIAKVSKLEEVGAAERLLMTNKRGAGIPEDDREELPSLPESREEVLHALNDERLQSSATPHDIYQLLLLLWGVRPGCIVSITTYVSTREAAEVRTIIPEEYLKRDGVGEFLTEYQIPHTLSLNISDLGPEEGFQIGRNYYISFDAERVDRIETILNDASPWKSLTPEAHLEIGRFLGYPEDAVQSWPTWEPEDDEMLFDQFSHRELLERTEALQPFIDRQEMNLVEFVKYVLPYVPPSTVDCDEQVLQDIERFLYCGVLTIVKYDIDLLSPFLIQYFEYHQAEE